MTSKIEISRELAAILADDHAPYQHLMAAKVRLREIIAEPEAPHQEPVAEVQHGPFDDVGAPQWVRVVTLGDFDLENLPDGMKLYAAPLSPDHSGGAGKVVFDPCTWTDRQVLDFLSIALRNVDVVGELRLSEIRQGFEYMRSQIEGLDKVKELNQ